jgi:hypothetical protein
MSYLASNLIFYLENCVKMQYKPIENYHMENAVLGKDFNLGVTNFLFHAFTHLSNLHISGQLAYIFVVFLLSCLEGFVIHISKHSLGHVDWQIVKLPLTSVISSKLCSM